jgi:hypothetical protein
MVREKDSERTRSVGGSLQEMIIMVVARCCFVSFPLMILFDCGLELILFGF